MALYMVRTDQSGEPGGSMWFEAEHAEVLANGTLVLFAVGKAETPAAAYPQGSWAVCYEIDQATGAPVGSRKAPPSGLTKLDPQ